MLPADPFSLVRMYICPTFCFGAMQSVLTCSGFMSGLELTSITGVSKWLTVIDSEVISPSCIHGWVRQDDEL